MTAVMLYPNCWERRAHILPAICGELLCLAVDSRDVFQLLTGK